MVVEDDQNIQHQPPESVDDMDVSVSMQSIDPTIKSQRVNNCHIETLYTRLVSTDRDVSYHPMSMDPSRRKRKVDQMDPEEREVLEFVTQRQSLLYITAPMKRRKIDPKIVIAVRKRLQSFV